MKPPISRAWLPWWLRAHNVGEKVSAVVNMEVKGVSPDALREIGLAVKTMVGKAEVKLSAVNEACETKVR